MDERKNNRTEPWDDGVYGTGKTNPPKSYGGIIALLLILVIFLSGIASALGILNIRLSRELNGQNDSAIPMSFSETEDTGSTDPSETTDSSAASASEAASQKDVSLDLKDTPESTDNVPQEGGLSLQEIYEKNISSVVSISCESQSGSTSGTGVILSDKGYIVTNCHVVDNAHTITVLLSDDRTFAADLVGADTVSDLAVLYISAENLTPAEFGDSGVLRVGDAVAAIGDPLGSELRGTMTNGIVSAINRDVSVDGRILTLIQTNAALNSGNSGGPLINCYGQVIGINTMKISAFVDKAGVEDLGFAIPSTTVKEIVDQLIQQGYVSGRPTLGIQGEDVTSFFQHYYNLPMGLYITAVKENSPASQAGIQPGDVLMAVNDTWITKAEDLDSFLYSHEVGDTVTVMIYRARKQYTAQLILTESTG